MTISLRNIVAQNLAADPKALPSFCTANARVLKEIVTFCAANDLPVLIEATCNQVNQLGGYTGQTPKDFVKTVKGLATEAGLSHEKLILGGDHLGPNPWRSLPATEAMARAKVLVKDYVEAGFTKIHLDASMACGSEETPSFELVAQRSAELCLVAERHAPDASRLSYVIGTEVPVPGGESDDMSGIQITTPDRLRDTVETHKAAFAAAGVPQGIEKAIAVVVQPGVDFSHDSIIHYDRPKAADLAKAIHDHPGLAFEAHSTDYQSTGNLSDLVSDHSVILKVGPEITFRFREGVMALDQIEAALNLPHPASVKSAILQAMEEDPSDWQVYYRGPRDLVDHLKLYSFSDRIRYYWDRDIVSDALALLFKNLGSKGISATVASQFGINFPIPTAKVQPDDLIAERVQATVSRYYQACRWQVPQVGC